MHSGTFPQQAPPQWILKNIWVKYEFVDKYRGLVKNIWTLTRVRFKTPKSIGLKGKGFKKGQSSQNVNFLNLPQKLWRWLWSRWGLVVPSWPVGKGLPISVRLLQIFHHIPYFCEAPSNISSYLLFLGHGGFPVLVFCGSGWKSFLSVIR